VRAAEGGRASVKALLHVPSLERLRYLRRRAQTGTHCCVGLEQAEEARREGSGGRQSVSQSFVARALFGEAPLLAPARSDGHALLIALAAFALPLTSPLVNPRSFAQVLHALPFCDTFEPHPYLQ
jgi:hypothetical protein